MFQLKFKYFKHNAQKRCLVMLSRKQMFNLINLLKRFRFHYSKKINIECKTLNPIQEKPFKLSQAGGWENMKIHPNKKYFEIDEGSLTIYHHVITPKLRMSSMRNEKNVNLSNFLKTK